MTFGGFLLSGSAVCLILAASIGCGLGILRLFGVLGAFNRFEAAVWAFPVGFGLLGWIVFYLAACGAIQKSVFLVLLALALPGLSLLSQTRREPPEAARTAMTWFLYVVLAALAFADFCEALAPPADADSLAYHFALPQQFVEAGKLVFVPRSVDGAIPLLVHMNWMIAYTLGGEMAMTLLAGATGWLVGFLVFVIARSYMTRDWALGVGLVFVSTPAVLYGAGSGQIEVRLCLFATVGAFALARGIRDRHDGFIALAGLSVGFFMASKYTGLLFAGAATMVLLLFYRSRTALLAFAVTAAVAGCQWYLWNWWHTGDPIFPALFAWFHLPDSDIWTFEQDVIFRSTYAAAESPLPRNIYWLLAYPFEATFRPIVQMESGRTGLGLFCFLVIPFAIFAVWRLRAKELFHPLMLVGFVAVTFYVLWFASGISQRVRHLLPILPLLLICLCVAAARCVEKRRLARLLGGIMVMTLLIQTGGQAVFGATAIQYVLSDERREEFLERSVVNYSLVRKSEKFMGAGDRILIDARQLIYLFTRPVFYYHAIDQAQIVARNVEADPKVFLNQLRRQRVTMLLIRWPVGSSKEPSDLANAAQVLADRGCAREIESMSTISFASRSMKDVDTIVPATLYRLTEDGCQLL